MLINMQHRGRSTIIAALFTLLLPTTLQAWTGPTAAPPGNNVSAPINIGTNEQFKPGVIGANIVNIYGAAQYLNFGNMTGTAGFGLRNDAGIIQFKHAGGVWSALVASPWISDGSSLSFSGGPVGIGSSAPAAQLYVSGGSYPVAGGLANQTAYALGAQSIAADASIYSYGKICAGNSSGNCEGSGGVVISGTGIKFPDGSSQTTSSRPTKYDSGWFAANTATQYVRNHGLGSVPDIVQVWYSDTADGSGDVSMIGSTNYAAATTTINDVDSTSVRIHSGSIAITYYYSSASVYKAPTTGYIKIVAIKL
jgi:hypothetical protein